MWASEGRRGDQQPSNKIKLCHLCSISHQCKLHCSSSPMVYLFLSSPRPSTLLFEAAARDRQPGWHVVTTSGGKEASHLPHQGWTLGSMASRIAQEPSFSPGCSGHSRSCLPTKCHPWAELKMGLQNMLLAMPASNYFRLWRKEKKNPHSCDLTRELEHYMK